MKLLTSFKARIGLLVALAVAGMLVLTALSFWQLRGQIVEARKQELKVAVQAAHTIVDAYQKKAADGAMPLADAQAAAKDALRVARYGAGGTDYYYIYTLDGVNVLLPTKPEWAGQNLMGKIKMGNGADLLQTMTDAAKRSADGWAYVDTQFPRPGETVAVDKLQLVAVVPQWNWMVGSGLYMDDVQAQVRAALLQSLAFAAVVVALLGAAGVAVARTLLRQIGGEPAVAIAAMREVAAGNLSIDVDSSAPDSLLAALQDTVVSLRRVVGEVRGSVEAVATASAQIATGSLDLSGRTEHAAASIQQTAASMEQLTGTVANTCNSAQTAHQLATEASSTAAQGSQGMQQVIETMARIDDSASRIAEIVGVIDGIAFQTNILALNAAVEAARAGEQGRGFAVVAAEVRTLAQRSATAAREIKALIHESVERVRSGSSLVEQSGRSIAAIVHSVERFVTTIDEISHAAREQSSGIGQVNTAIASLDRATQENSALVEESNAAAESLKDQARALNQTMSVFRLA